MRCQVFPGDCVWSGGLTESELVHLGGGSGGELLRRGLLRLLTCLLKLRRLVRLVGQANDGKNLAGERGKKAISTQY